MQSILAVVDGTERTNHALRAAVERADGDGANLVVVNVTSPGEYQNKRAAMAKISGLAGERYEWTVDQAEASATDAARRQARLAAGDGDVDWTAEGRVGDPRWVLLAVAAEYDCSEIVIAKSRSRWFGLRPGLDRTLAGRFDGTVTAVPEPGVDETVSAPRVPEPGV